MMMLSPLTSRAEDGSKLWLRYVAEANVAKTSQAVREVSVPGQSPTLEVIRQEVGTALAGLAGRRSTFVEAPSDDGALIIGTPQSSAAIASLGWAKELEHLGREGFIIRSSRIGGRRAMV